MSSTFVTRSVSYFLIELIVALFCRSIAAHPHVAARTLLPTVPNPSGGLLVRNNV
jgi:hypothetical protein